jgi:hypothetical protein
MNEWYFVAQDKRFGPVSAARVMELLREGSLTTNTPVWTSAFGNEWRPLGLTALAELPPQKDESRVRLAGGSKARVWTRVRWIVASFVVFATILGGLLAWQLLSPKTLHQGNPSEAELAHAMTKIGAAWHIVIDKQLPLVRGCIGGDYAAYLLDRAATVEFDVKRTDNLLRPYVGTLVIRSRLYSNERDSRKRPEGSSPCFPRPLDALEAMNKENMGTAFFYSGEQLLTAEYKFENGAVTLEKANQQFRSFFLPHIRAEYNQPVWGFTYSQPIR